MSRPNGMGRNSEPPRTAALDRSDAVTRILLATDSFLPHAGGSRVYYYNLYRRLSDSFDSNVTVLTSKVPGWREFDCSPLRGRLRIVRRFRPLPNWKHKQLPKIALRLPETVTASLLARAEVIHAGDFYPQAASAMAIRAAFGTPYLVFAHGEEITTLDRNRYLSRLRNAVYTNADAVVCNAEFTRAQLIRIGVKPARIHKITPAVDVERFRPQERDRELMRRFDLNGCTVLLTVARLVSRKGHRLVMDAVARLRGAHPDLRYVIAGTGPDLAALREYAGQLGIAGHVRFAGYVPDSELSNYYNLADVFVMPNREETGDLEGFGMTFLEAGACGKPAIGGRSGGAEESIAEGVSGFLTDPDDAAELAQTLERMLQNAELRNKLGDQARRRACADFTWDSRALLLHEVHRSLTAKQKSLPVTVAAR